ncbi:hypothetical protein D3C86_471390 [compost metagenome]
MIGGDRRGHLLHHHRLAGLGRGHDQRTLTLALRCHQIEDAAGDVLGRTVAAFQGEALAREQRGEVLEQHLVLGRFQRLTVDGVHDGQREVALAVLGEADAAGQVVAGAQVEAADLAGRNVGIVRAGQVAGFCGTQETEAVRQDFQHAIGGHTVTVAGEHLEQGKDHVLLAGAGHAFGNLQLLGDFQQLLRRHALEVAQRIDREALGHVGLLAAHERLLFTAVLRHAVVVVAIATAVAVTVAAIAEAVTAVALALALVLTLALALALLVRVLPALGVVVAVVAILVALATVAGVLLRAALARRGIAGRGLLGRRRSGDRRRRVRRGSQGQGGLLCGGGTGVGSGAGGGLGDARLAHALLGRRVSAPGFGSSDIGQVLDSSLEGASARQGGEVWERILERTSSRRCGARMRPDAADTNTGSRRRASRVGQGHSCRRRARGAADRGRLPVWIRPGPCRACRPAGPCRPRRSAGPGLRRP